MKYQEFIASLKGQVQPVYLFYGKEAFLRQDALKRLKTALLPEGLEMLNYTELTNPAVQDLIACAETLPFMCDRRLVVVRDLALLGKDDKTGAAEKRTGADAEAETEALLSYLDRLPDSACIVFEAGDTVDKRRKLTKKLAAMPGAVTFDPPDDSDLQRFLLKRARASGLEMTAEACQRLLFLSGRDMTALTAEMEKLAAYAGARGRIDTADVDAIATRTAEARVFDMIDDVIEGRTGQAYTRLSTLLEAGEARLGILALITRQYRQMLYVKDMLSARRSQQEIAAQLGIKPFIVSRLGSRVRTMSSGELEEKLTRCIETDYAVKSGQMREDAALDTLLLHLQRKQ